MTSFNINTAIEGQVQFNVETVKSGLKMSIDNNGTYVGFNASDKRWYLGQFGESNQDFSTMKRINAGEAKAYLANVADRQVMKNVAAEVEVDVEAMQEVEATSRHIALDIQGGRSEAAWAARAAEIDAILR